MRGYDSEYVFTKTKVFANPFNPFIDQPYKILDSIELLKVCHSGTQNWKQVSIRVPVLGALCFNDRFYFTSDINRNWFGVSAGLYFRFLPGRKR